MRADADTSIVGDRQGSTNRPRSAERRRVLRIDVDDRIEGRLLVVDGDVALTVQNISERGFLMAGSQPFYRGDVRDFCFAMSVGDPITMRGRIVRTARMDDGSGTTYLGGVEFVRPARDGERIKRLLEALHAPASRL